MKNSVMMNDRWVCSQIGTREHYLVPRALKKLNQHVDLITEFWVPPDSLLYRISKTSRSRYHEDLRDIPISNFNYDFLVRRLVSPKSDWDVLFDRMASKKLQQVFNGTQQNFFTNSYASRLTLRTAHTLGMKKIYQQINGGPVEADIVIQAYEEEFGKKYAPFVPDEAYWDRWYEEITYPDKIIVNSEWAKTLLIRSTADPKKIEVVPFSFQSSKERIPKKKYPESFSVQRPLNVLFLGGVSIRKGFHVFKRAMADLIHAPIVAHVVGRLTGPEELLHDLPDNVKYHGQVSPFQTDIFYRDADVFILPTLSDGFALTQLEAFFYRLPVITTPFCGEVVSHMQNGYVMKDVTVRDIKESIEYFIQNPEKLEQFSENTITSNEDPLTTYGSAVMNIAESVPG